ncbi:xanthine dehydrogenase [Arthrobacter sp. SPG23]|uniref:XdhC family protein n=1 Tax=Arthrobacter sp. SPG23 TaxID=1610703 RepID=UPI0005B81E81|nr:XdhC/CoxI family protein [Arthrobacter sp. SPG23]KIS25821.1 xanthine dehydrogenase [Arthrobacter sp. SPG23]
MLDLMPSLKEWQPAATGQRCALATVVWAGGSVPRPLGTSMLVSEAGDVLGSLSGGCVEGAVVEAALAALHDGGTRREFFGYSTEDAFAVGLTCGGELEIHIEPLGTAPGGLRLENLRVLAGQGPGSALALIRRVDAHGGGAVVIPDPASFLVEHSAELAVLLGLPELSPRAAARLMRAAAAQLEPLLRGGRTGLVRLAPAEGCLSGMGVPPGQTTNSATSPEPITLLVESRLPLARLLIFGANDFGAALLPAAQLLGYHVTLCDARPAFAGQSRFAGADQVVTAWPHRYLAEEAAAGRIDARTVACVLTHDPKFDIPLLQTALGLDLAYVGAMGSRRSHRQRVDSLLAAGVGPEDLSRLHSPIGLDLGAVTPAEVAVSITAELVASRTRSAGASVQAASLKDVAGPIHGTGPIHGAGTSHKASPIHNVNTPQHQETPWI